MWYWVISQYSTASKKVEYELQLRATHLTIQQIWAGELKDLLLQMKEAVMAAKHRGQSALAPEVSADFEAQYQAWLRQTDRLAPPRSSPHKGQTWAKKRSVIRCLLDRLRSQQVWVLAFLHNFAIPFDNSQAEHDIRMVKSSKRSRAVFAVPQVLRPSAAFVALFLPCINKVTLSFLPLTGLSLVIPFLPHSRTLLSSYLFII